MSITGNYSDYDAFTSASTAVGAGFVGALLVVWGIMMLISLAISVLMIVSMWKIFTQNEKPGWYSLIPILNIWTLFELVGIHGWLCLIPFANAVFVLIANYKLAIKYGKSQGFAVVTLLFPYVGYPILAFGKKKEEAKAEAKEEVKEEKEAPKKTTKASTSKKTAKFCSKCGTEMEKGAKFCPKCGTKSE